jgi:3-phytase
MKRHILLNTIYFISGLLFLCACESNRPSEGSKKAGEHIKNTVTAVAETMPVPRDKNDDSADDPAIWIDSEDVTHSFVIGTDKKGGLATYNLDGEQLKYYPDGKMNNCDLRYGFMLNGKMVDVLAASNRSNHSVALYTVEKGGVLNKIDARVIESKMTEDVYGLCMYKSPVTGKMFVYVNSKSGEVEQWELFESNAKIDAKLVRSFHVKTQTEGMVADDSTAVVYLGEENAGIHKFCAEPDSATDGIMIALSSEENKNIKFDLEGLTLYATDSLNGYLIASSQGNYSYAVFERQGDNKYLGSFRIVDGTVDGVEETDGIDVTNVQLGAKYPKGMFVVQDGYNYEGKKLTSQNFKYISWTEIEKLLK